MAGEGREFNFNPVIHPIMQGIDFSSACQRARGCPQHQGFLILNQGYEAESVTWGVPPH